MKQGPVAFWIDDKLEVPTEKDSEGKTVGDELNVERYKRNTSNIENAVTFNETDSYLGKDGNNTSLISSTNPLRNITESQR